MLPYVCAYYHLCCSMCPSSHASSRGTYWYLAPTMGRYPQSNTHSHPLYRSLPIPQTNISNLPVRSSASATGGTVAMSQDLSDLQERMKKIQNLGAAVTGAGQPF